MGRAGDNLSERNLESAASGRRAGGGGRRSVSQPAAGRRERWLRSSFPHWPPEPRGRDPAKLSPVIGPCRPPTPPPWGQTDMAWWPRVPGVLLPAGERRLRAGPAWLPAAVPTQLVLPPHPQTLWGCSSLLRSELLIEAPCLCLTSYTSSPAFECAFGGARPLTSLCFHFIPDLAACLPSRGTLSPQPKAGASAPPSLSETPGDSPFRGCPDEEGASPASGLILPP